MMLVMRSSNPAWPSWPEIASAEAETLVKNQAKKTRTRLPGDHRNGRPGAPIGIAGEAASHDEAGYRQGEEHGQGGEVMDRAMQAFR